MDFTKSLMSASSSTFLAWSLVSLLTSEALANHGHKKDTAQQQTQEQSAQQQESETSTEPPVFVICHDEKLEINKKELIDGYIKQINVDFASTDYKRLCHEADFSDWQKVTLKTRGNSSSHFEKKQLGVKLVDENGKKVEKSLLGLAKDNNWVFNGDFVDRTHFRNAFTYRLGRKLGKDRGEKWFAPGTRTVEVIVNGDYKGAYTLIEKIKRGSSRVDIKKVDLEEEHDISYIMEVSARTGVLKSKRGTELKYVYPDSDDMAEWKNNGQTAASRVEKEIIDNIDHFEAVLASKGFADQKKGYPSLINVESFIDFFIMQEVSKNIDGFRRSMYFHKDRNGKITMGPMWDYDLAWGNITFHGADNPVGFNYNKVHLMFRNVKWFKRLMKDPAFRTAVKERYFDLRSPGRPLHMDEINADLDQFLSKLGSAPERDRARWHSHYNFIQRKIMYTRKHAHSYSEDVKIMRNWIVDRLSWLDKNIEKW